MNALRPLFGSASTAYYMRGQRRYAFQSWQRIRRDQARRVREMVHYAYRYVPYYRETMRRLGLDPADCQTASDLQKLPLLDREPVQRDPEYFVSRREPLSRHLRLHNSGTTARPCTFYYHTNSLFQNRAINLRSLAVLGPWLARTFGYRRTVIESSSGGAGTVGRAHQSLSFLPPGLRFQDQILSPLDPPEKNLALINQFKPDLVIGYGSYFALLAARAQRTGSELHCPKAIIFSADALPGQAREFFNDLGAPAFSKYSATEAPELGFECEQHTGLHLNIDAYPVRILDEQGRPAPPGESGEVVVSNLVNRATVLLNYRLSDIATMLPDACPCGRVLPLLALHQGRVDDWIALPSGEIVHPGTVHSALKRVGGIWQWQLVQRSPRRLLLRIVAAEPCEQQVLKARVEQAIRHLMGGQVELKIDFVREVERTPGAKVRPVISLLNGKSLAESLPQVQ